MPLVYDDPRQPLEVGDLHQAFLVYEALKPAIVSCSVRCMFS